MFPKLVLDCSAESNIQEFIKIDKYIHQWPIRGRLTQWLGLGGKAAIQPSAKVCINHRTKIKEDKELYVIVRHLVC